MDKTLGRCGWNYRIIWLHQFYNRVIIFGSVWFLSKKVTKPIFFFKKTKIEPKPGQTDRFRFDSVWFFRAKTGLNRFGSVFLCWLGFLGFGSVVSGFGSVFLVWLGFFCSVFFWFRFGSVWFFRFFAYKTKPNWPVLSKF